MCFRCYGNLKFPYTYNGKSGIWHLFLCYCRYFDKSFTRPSHLQCECCATVHPEPCISCFIVKRTGWFRPIFSNALMQTRSTLGLLCSIFVDVFFTCLSVSFYLETIWWVISYVGRSCLGLLGTIFFFMPFFILMPLAFFCQTFIFIDFDQMLHMHWFLKRSN